MPLPASCPRTLYPKNISRIETLRPLLAYREDNQLRRFRHIFQPKYFSKADFSKITKQFKIDQIEHWVFFYHFQWLDCQAGTSYTD